jgi:hypothetical protein
MHWWLDLVEHENRRPSMMVDGFFVVRLQGYLKHAKPLILEEDIVVFWRCDHGVQRRSQVDGSKSARLSVMGISR